VRVITLDPGMTTGVAAYDSRRHIFEAMQCPPREAMEWLSGEIDANRVDLVVYETFRISARTVKQTQAGSLVAIETIGVARWLCDGAGVEFINQDPGEAMGFATNERLKHLGVYATADHARDAVRHLVLVCIKRGIIPASSLV